MKQKIKKINSLLIKRFGIPAKSKNPPEPVDLLIATILSQNTNDKNSYKAFRNLKEKYNSWESVAALPASKLEKEIKTAGLGKQKSIAINSFLNTLVKEKGKINLGYLNQMNDDEILDELIKYNGIGVKTASCVLLFSMEKNICPVDTHVHRTTNRLGLVNTKTPDKTFLQLKNQIPDGAAHSFHTNLIRLGREICKPAKPFCSICPLLNVCEYDSKNLDKAGLPKEKSFMLLDNVR